MSSLQAEYVAPRNEVELVICEVWQEVLGVERVGIHDNFFELGGHSLLVMQVISRLQQAGIAMTARQLFALPTLAELAKELGNADSSDKHALIYAAPANLIPPNAVQITPDMLPLVALTEEDIQTIVSQVPGGAANVQDIYPLGPLQEGILFHHMMNPIGDPYVMPMLFRIRDLDSLSGFIKALEFVIARHDALRTAVLWDGLSTPIQVVCRQASLPVQWIEAKAGISAQARMQQLCAADVQQMDITRGPLLKLQVMRVEDSEEHFVLLQVHHLVTDHVGLEIIQHEIGQFERGEAASLPVPAAYREFIAHTRHQAKHNDAEAYFRRVLGDIEAPTAPFDLLDSRRDGSEIVELREGVPAEISRQLREIARRMKVSPAALFHSAWGLVLSACSCRDDVVFGTVVSGRLQGTVGAESMMGVFINTLPFRLRLKGQNVLELVTQAHEYLLGLLPYEQTPLALAQRCTRLPGGTPLFSAMLNYRHSGQNNTPGEVSGNYTLISAQERSNYVFNLAVDVLDEEFELDIQVDGSLHAPRIMGYMQSALAGLAKSLSQTSSYRVDNTSFVPVSAISILGQVEREQLLIGWNDTEADYPRDKCIHHLFEAQVLKSPQAVAVTFAGTSLTYARLNARANQLAQALLERGLLKKKQTGSQETKRIGICLPRSLDMLIAMLAVLKAGGAYVPLDPDYPSSRLSYLLQDAGLDTVITHRGVLSAIPVLVTQGLCLDDKELQASIQTQPEANLLIAGLSADELAYVIYTSGSTGNPKGVMVEHGAVVNFLCSMAHTPGLEETDKLLAVTSTAFDIHVLEMFLPLVCGAHLVIGTKVQSQDPEKLSAMIAELGISVMQATPATWKMLVESKWQVNSALKVLCGGEALSHSLARAILASGPVTLWNMYGPTETTVWSSVQRVSLEDSKVLMGQPIANTSMYVVNTEMALLPVGVPGELLIGGRGLARGYLGQDALSAERFIRHPFSTAGAEGERVYRTGDMVRRLVDGSLEFLGRADHQVKVQGFRIELGEIENLLLAHEEVKDVVVLAMEAGGDKQLIAYFIPAEVQARGGHWLPESPELANSIARLRDYVRAHLPLHMVPSVFRALKSFPLTLNEKVDRKALSELEVVVVTAAYQPAETETERALCDIWQMLLGVAQIGVTENFFQLGGHSLLAIKLLGIIKHQFQVELSVKTLFELPDIQSLAAYLDVLRPKGAGD
ncbi:non-ribosomal peptide synthetase, partial [Rheinheimera gaetbuli]